MTEHSKSQPRIYDELSSSHEIVHQGDRDAVSMFSFVGDVVLDPFAGTGTTLLAALRS